MLNVMHGHMRSSRSGTICMHGQGKHGHQARLAAVRAARPVLQGFCVHGCGRWLVGLLCLNVKILLPAILLHVRVALHHAVKRRLLLTLIKRLLITQIATCRPLAVRFVGACVW